MSYYMVCVLWLGALDVPPTIRYAKGEALALKIAAGLWVNKANKGYCVVGDRLYEHPSSVSRDTSPSPGTNP